MKLMPNWLFNLIYGTKPIKPECTEKSTESNHLADLVRARLARVEARIDRSEDRLALLEIERQVVLRTAEKAHD